MYQTISNWIKNQPRYHFWLRLMAVLLVLALLAANIYSNQFWRSHASLGIDVDYRSGRIMQVFIGADHSALFSLDDRILAVNGAPAANFLPIRDLKAGQFYTLAVESIDGDVRTVSIPARLITGMAFAEHAVFPLFGLIFSIFALVLLLIEPVNRISLSFMAFMFVSSLLFLFFNFVRYAGGIPAFVFHLAMILVIWTSLEFHWAYLNIHLSITVLKIARVLILLFGLAFIFCQYLSFPNSLFSFELIYYVAWLISFLFFLFLFTFQYVYDQLSRGMLRIMLLTFFAGLGPMIYFVLIPLTLGYPRSMPATVAVIPMFLLPINYGLLIQRKKQYARATCTVVSFILTLLIVYFMAEVGFAVLEEWLPGLAGLQRDWFSQLLIVLMIGISIILYSFVNRFVQTFVYGDAVKETRQMQQLSIDLRQMEDTNAILLQTAGVFQKFFDFTFLQISLQDGTLLHFDDQGNAKIINGDRVAVLSVLNRITFREAQPDLTLRQNVFIDLAGIDDLIKEYDQIFGENPQYVMLVDGRSYPMGVISAGQRKNGERFDVVEVQQLQALLAQYQAIVENLFLMDEVDKRSQQVRKMGQQLLEARENERKRIARDIHDNVIQSLTAFRYSINDLYDKDKLAISDEEADELQRSLQIISQDIRDICFNLRPPALDATGFRSAIVSIVESHHRKDQLNIKLDISDSPVIDRLSDMVSICLYRVLQEALTNIQKYAKTDDVWVTLNAAEDFVQLLVEDNGVGFTVPERLNDLVMEGHFGLTGVQEFLEMVNGVFTIRSNPGSGSRLTAQIPLVKTGGDLDLYYDYRR